MKISKKCGRKRIEGKKHFRALIVSRLDVSYSDKNNISTITAFWFNDRANNLSTFLNRLKRDGYRVVVAFEVGSQKHKDVLKGKHMTR